jgi:hypothetical protein
MEVTNEGKQKADPKVRIIDSFWTFLVATAVLGPFALPLLWRNPRYKVSTKIIASIAVILFTVWLVNFATEYLNKTLQDLNLQMQELQ